jgi:uncharacterized membrane protein
MQDSGVAVKTRVFTILVVVSNVAGNYLLSVGLRQVGSLIGKSPLAYIAALFNGWVAAGVALLIVWMFSQLALLSWADLSYVMPVTSIGYVLAAVVGRVFLHETVSWQRWAGIWLIVLGVLLVSRTGVRRRKTVEPAKELVCS